MKKSRSFIINLSFYHVKHSFGKIIIKEFNANISYSYMFENLERNKIEENNFIFIGNTKSYFF